MKRTTILANRIREVLLNGQWIANTNFKDQISRTDWLQATHKLQQLNTIAALSYHINYYMAGMLQAFRTGKLTISDQYSFDVPPINSQSGWDLLVAEFLSNAEKFSRSVDELEDQRLPEIFFDEKYGNFERNIEGFIEHSYYHLGQIVLIRKLIAQNN